ncbi:hypothetical protein EDC01DRAFT_784717 [Geopyxis carbonaria]|nr:hypothetical protein EDC01DRAFT_784717 [Geopyxis carbonaria]
MQLPSLSLLLVAAAALTSALPEAEPKNYGHYYKYRTKTVTSWKTKTVKPYGYYRPAKTVTAWKTRTVKANNYGYYKPSTVTETEYKPTTTTLEGAETTVTRPCEGAGLETLTVTDRDTLTVTVTNGGGEGPPSVITTTVTESVCATEAGTLTITETAPFNSVGGRETVTETAPASVTSFVTVTVTVTD